MELEYFNDLKKWTKFDIPLHSDKWHEFRTLGCDGYDGGFGASEIGKVLGVDEYRPVLPELFRIKVGMLGPSIIPMNEAMFHGTFNEEFILNYWQFEDGNLSYLKRWPEYLNTGDESLKVRHASKPSYYLVNNRFPWLFTSLDSVVPSGSAILDKETNTLEGEVCAAPFPLECKMVSERSIQKYKNQINPKHIAQVFQQMIITESSYGELVMLVDGRHLRTIGVHWNGNYVEELLSRSKSVWLAIMQAREHWAAYKHFDSKNLRKEALKEYREIMMLEPPVNGVKKLEEYLRESYVAKENKRIPGTPSMYEMVLDYERTKACERELSKIIQLRKNKILDVFNKTGGSYIDFGDAGRVNFKSKLTTSRIDINEKVLMETLKPWIKNG